MSQYIPNKLEALVNKIILYVTPPNIIGGNDLWHIQRVIKIGLEEVSELLEFDVDEFVAAAWLHELDRSKSFKRFLEDNYVNVQEKVARRLYLKEVLIENADFGNNEVDSIIDAVMQHSKFADDPGDSNLLTALRIADKLDRMGLLGLVTAAIHRGAALPLFDPQNPYGYTSTDEGKLKSVYNDWFRVFEWYAMLPSDEARELAEKPHRLPARIAAMRQLAKEISLITGVSNAVEEDFKKAFGKYYEHLCG